jgi:hypothetical protein
MKKMFAVFTLLVSVSLAFANPPVTEKVLQKFKESFPAIQEVKWYEGNDYYEAYFEKDGVKYHLLYNPDGKVTGSRNYYTADKLSPFLKAKVGEKYPGKTIFGVTEITNSDEMYYVLALEDDTTWTNIRMDATGQIHQLEKMQKAAK